MKVIISFVNGNGCNWIQLHEKSMHQHIRPTFKYIVKAIFRYVDLSVFQCW